MIECAYYPDSRNRTTELGPPLNHSRSLSMQEGRLLRQRAFAGGPPVGPLTCPLRRSRPRFATAALRRLRPSTERQPP